VLVILCFILQMSVSIVFISFELLIINIVLVNGPFLSGVCSASTPPVCVHHVGLLLMALRCVRVLRCGGGSKDSLTSVVQILPLAFCTKLK
jgi:hypothetical protein